MNTRSMLVVVVGFALLAGPQQRTAPRAAEPNDVAAKETPSVAEPTTSAEARKLLDLQSFPTLNGATIEQVSPVRLVYTVAVDVATAMQFQLAELAERGWQTLAGPGSAFKSGNYQSQLLTKQGYHLQVEVIDHGGSVRVELENQGNVDVRSFPVPDGAQAFADGNAVGVSYTNVPPVEESAEACRDEMAKRGWIEYQRKSALSPIPLEIANSRVIPFVKNGITCYLYVATNEHFNDGKPFVSYALTGFLPNDLSVPAGASRVRVDTEKPTVQYTAAGSLNEVADRIRQRATDFGWTAMPDQPPSSPRQLALAFQSESEPGLQYRVNLQEEDYQRIRVVYSLQREAQSEPDSAEPELAQNATSTDTAFPDVSPVERPNQSAGTDDSSKIAADEFPLPPDAKRVGRDFNTEVIMIDSDLPAEQVAAFYKKELGKLGWKANENLGIGDNTMQMFQRGALTINVVTPEQANPFASIFVQGDGIEWQEDSAAQVAGLADQLADQLAEPPAEMRAEVEAATEPLQSLTEEVANISAAEAEEPPADKLSLDNSLASQAKNIAQCKLSLGEQEFQFEHGVAYQFIEDDEKIIGIILSEQPIAHAKIMQSLRQGDGVSMFDVMGFESFEYLQIRLSEYGTSCNCYVAGASISFGGSQKLADKLTTDKGWIRGSIATDEPQEFFDKELTFTAKLDLGALQVGSGAPEPASAGRLKDYRGVPIPHSSTETQLTGTKYATLIQTNAEESADKILAAYREELPELGWQLVGDTTSDQLKFRGESGELVIEVKSEGGQTIVSASLKQPDLAAADGLLPKPGKAKLILGNAFAQDATVTIGKRDYPIKSGVGGQDPSTAIKYDVGPGQYSVVIKVPGEEPVEEQFLVKPDTVWGILIGPDGFGFADQMY